MISPIRFRELVSGEWQGVGPSLLRVLCAAAEVPYRAAMAVRNARYDRGSLLAHPISVPVISVGNLTVGGVGKTPFVVWLARWFRQRGIRVSVVSRGYGAEHGSRNDEALDMEQQLPDVPHAINPDRVAGAQLAVEEFESQLILLDDGFQHRRIRRDLDIVLLDALEPFGYGHLLPRGLLREPVRSLRRAQVVVLSRADAVDASRRDAIWQQVCAVRGPTEGVECCHAPAKLQAASGRELPITELAGKRIAAFCGIGNAAGFRHTLRASGYVLTDWREFPDHHRYSREDLDSLVGWLRALPGIDAIVCTSKDLVKIRADELAGIPLWALAIELQVTRGLDVLERHLNTIAQRSC